MNISVILAAGEGTRMKSNIPKVLHKVCGKTILEYVLESSERAGIEDNIVIIGHGGEKVKKSLENTDLNVIFEEQPIGEGAPYGTGYAVKQAEEHIKDDHNVVILCGDAPLITAETIGELLEYHETRGYDGTVLTALLEDPTGYGRILRDDSGDIDKIVEDKDADEKIKKIKEINSGVYCFNGKLLKYAISKISNNNAQGEFYITDVVGILKDKGYKLGAKIIRDNRQIYGINSKIELAYSQKIMQERINNYHMKQGVILINPENTYIDSGVKIGRDTVIYPGVHIEKNSHIGKECLITNGTRIVNSTLSDGVTVDSSLIIDSKVGENTKIGPNAHLRPNSIVGNNCKIGNFVEIKNSLIKDGVKASHLAYIGDAEVGKNVNIGCGVIFANYDGKKKQKIKVGENAFIGSNSNLIAPVKISKEAYIAAGSTIIKNVGEGDLSIARSRQVNKPGWVKETELKK